MIFYKGQISTDYKKIKLKILVFSVALARTDNSFTFVREITPMKNKKSIILESNPEYAMSNQ